MRSTARIVELFEQRMELTDQVAAYKIATGKAVFDPGAGKAEVRRRGGPGPF